MHEMIHSLISHSLQSVAFLAVFALAACAAKSAESMQLNVWVGSGGTEGIHLLQWSEEQGTLSQPTVAAGLAGSGFIAIHPNGQFLYSTGRENNEEILAAFRIHRTSGLPTLERINEQPIGDGGSACIAVDKTGHVLMSAQYGGGSVATFSINDDGSLGPRVALVEHGKGSGVDRQRQVDAHPHWVGTSPDNRFLMVPDLGRDQVVVYELDPATAKLTHHADVSVPPGSGPRHMKFHPNGKFAYVLNEMKLTISCFDYQAATGKFREIQTIETLTEDQKDKYLQGAAEICVHPTGQFVYASNRGDDTISVFSVDQATGKLTFVERESIRGSWPRNFNLDPSGNWLIAGGQFSNTLSLFEVNPKSGALTFTRKIVNAPEPICILFDAPPKSD